MTCHQGGSILSTLSFSVAFGVGERRKPARFGTQPHLLRGHRLEKNRKKVTITIKNRPGGQRIQCRPTLALNQAHFLCPSGTHDNSPAFQRRERRKILPSPAGTTEAARSKSAVPFGTGSNAVRVPALKRWAILRCSCRSKDRRIRNHAGQPFPSRIASRHEPR
jgi:hypothetical protein